MRKPEKKLTLRLLIESLPDSMTWEEVRQEVREKLNLRNERSAYNLLNYNGYSYRQQIRKNERHLAKRYYDIADQHSLFASVVVALVEEFDSSKSTIRQRLANKGINEKTHEKTRKERKT